MHSVVPRGFAAYARILHPAIVRSLPDRAVPTSDEWDRLPEAEQQALVGRFADEPATWAQTAATFDTTLHPLAQWHRIVRTPTDGDWRTRIAPDGREFSARWRASSPRSTWRPSRRTSSVTPRPRMPVSPRSGRAAAICSASTASPRPAVPRPSRTTRTIRRCSIAARTIRSTTSSANPPGRRGILSREISEGPRLRLPMRDHVLFSAPPRAFADPEWARQVPWRDRTAEERGFPRPPQSPSLLWPEDHAWVMMSEVDFDSTIVAGSPALIDALCADEHLEAFRDPGGRRPHLDADTVNPGRTRMTYAGQATLPQRPLARPLTDPVDTAAVRAFAAELRSRPSSRTSASPVIGIVAVAIAATFVLIPVMVSVIVSIASLGEALRRWRSPLVLIVLQLAAAGVMIWMGPCATRRPRGTGCASVRAGERHCRTSRSGRPSPARHDLQPRPVAAVDRPAPGHEAALRESSGNYQYTVQSGKNSTTYRWGYVAVKLDVPLPNIVLDAKGNNGFGSNLPASFHRSSACRSRATSTTHFTLYCPAGYERDALYLFTPDIMRGSSTTPRSSTSRSSTTGSSCTRSARCRRSIPRPGPGCSARSARC